LASLDTAQAKHAQLTQVRIIAFNDFHGNLQVPTQVKTASPADLGGADYLAAYIQHLESAYPNHVVVSAGDLTGASPQISAAFHDEPSVEIMSRLGLEFNAVGNHEFDYGQAELLRKQQGGCFPGGQLGVDTCVAQRFAGAKYRYLAANVLEEDTGKPLFPAYAIKKFKLSNGKSLSIAFIGLTLRATPELVTPSGVSGLSFADEVQTVNALVPELQAQGIEAIVVLIHQGGKQAVDTPNGINDCALTQQGLADPHALQPLRDIVSRFDDAIDLVVSGHSHTSFTCQLANSRGRLIPVTQADHYGQMLTTIDLSLDTQTGDVLASRVKNILVDRSNPAIHADKTIARLVQAYAKRIAPYVNQVVGTINAAVPNTDMDANSSSGESAVGDLIADAMLAATTAENKGEAQIAITNTGGIRAGLVSKDARYPYPVTNAELFSVQPFSNKLITLRLTAQQLKDVLEMQFPGQLCSTPSGINRQGDTARFLLISQGFSFVWQAGAPNCQKIQAVKYSYTDAEGKQHVDNLVLDGKVNNPTQTYRVTVNSYLAGGGDGFGVFTQGVARQEGMLDVEATAAYLKQFQSGFAWTTDLSDIPRIKRLP
jgi:5'-nucleotidase